MIKMKAKINDLLIQFFNVKRFLAENFTPASYKVPENIMQLRQEEYNVWCIRNGGKEAGRYVRTYVRRCVGMNE